VVHALQLSSMVASRIAWFFRRTGAGSRRIVIVWAVESDKHQRARDWLTKSGYGLEMRAAAACRSYWLPTNQSVPYMDPTQENTIREADVVVRLAGQLIGGDGWTLAAVIECKSPTAKPWVALMVPDTGGRTRSTLVRSISVDEQSADRLIYGAWSNFAPFNAAASADALVSVHVSDGQARWNNGCSCTECRRWHRDAERSTR
jgi:hypothetical protein